MVASDEGLSRPHGPYLEWVRPGTVDAIGPCEGDIVPGLSDEHRVFLQRRVRLRVPNLRQSVLPT